MSDLISLEPSEHNPIEGDIVEFRDGGFRWRVKRVIAPYIYLRSEIGSRFAVHPMTSIKMIWRGKSENNYIDTISAWEELVKL